MRATLSSKSWCLVDLTVPQGCLKSTHGQMDRRNFVLSVPVININPLCSAFQSNVKALQSGRAVQSLSRGREHSRNSKGISPQLKRSKLNRNRTEKWPSDRWSEPQRESARQQRAILIFAPQAERAVASWVLGRQGETEDFVVRLHRGLTG